MQISRICLDAATDARMSLWGAQATKDLCGGNTMTPLPGGGWSFSSTCDMGTGGKTTTSGTATGDFNVKYLVQAKSVTEGAAAPQMNGPHTVNIEAAWQGPCPAGTKPGDMTLPGGIKVNLLDLGVAK